MICRQTYSFLRMIRKKMWSFYVTSSCIFAFCHVVTIVNSEESKKIRRHNRILTNEELRSNEPHELNKNNQHVKKWINRVWNRKNSLYTSFSVPQNIRIVVGIYKCLHNQRFDSNDTGIRTSKYPMNNRLSEITPCFVGVCVSQSLFSMLSFVYFCLSVCLLLFRHGVIVFYHLWVLMSLCYF